MSGHRATRTSYPVQLHMDVYVCMPRHGGRGHGVHAGACPIGVRDAPAPLKAPTDGADECGVEDLAPPVRGMWRVACVGYEGRNKY